MKKRCQKSSDMLKHATSRSGLIPSQSYSKTKLPLHKHRATFILLSRKITIQIHSKLMQVALNEGNPNLIFKWRLLQYDL